MTIGPKNPHQPIEESMTLGNITRQRYADGELFQIELAPGISLTNLVGTLNDLGEFGLSGEGPMLMNSFSDDDGDLYLSFWVANK